MSGQGELSNIIRDVLDELKTLPPFDYMAPLPDLHIRHGRSWEPAARRYRDIEPEEKEQA